VWVEPLRRGLPRPATLLQAGNVLIDPRAPVDLELVNRLRDDLLALAVHHGGRLVTLERRLCSAAVQGGRAALWLIDR